MPTIETRDGATIRYRLQGSGEAAIPVVFLNGFLQTAVYWHVHARRLKGRHAVITYDARGQGESGPGAAAPTGDTHVSDLRAVLDDAGIDHAVLVGLSMGAYTAAAFAAAEPGRAAGCVLCSIGSGFARNGRPERWLETLETQGLERLSYELLEEVSGSAFSRLAPKHRRGFVEGILQRNRAEAVREQLRAFGRYRPIQEYAPALRRVVTRIVRGEEDRLVPAREAASLAASTGTRVVTIPDAGHSFPAEQPGPFAAVLDPLL